VMEILCEQSMNCS